MMEPARFVTKGATPLMPAPQPDDLSGLYWGFSTCWAMGIDGMMTMELDHRHLTLRPDGVFCDRTPPAGLAPFDQREAPGRGDMDWGTCRQADGTYTIRNGVIIRTPMTGRNLSHP